MAKPPFLRGQTQILYRFLPQAIFDHDDYGLCKVEEVIMEDSGSINKSALFDTLVDALQKWPQEEFRSKFPDPRTEKKQRMYRAGQPTEARFNPFPLVLQCKKCKHVVEYGNISKKGLQPGHCPRPGCDGHMQQMRFVEVHNCGRMEEMFVPRGCPEHGRTHIQFHDTGRAPTSHWICGVCHREIQKPRMKPCNCEYSDALPNTASPYDKRMRLYPTGEPGLYIPHVVAFINFSEEKEKVLSQMTDGLPLLLARVWGILGGKVLDIAAERKRWSPGNENLGPELHALIEHIEKTDPHNPLVEQYKRSKDNPPGQDKISQVRGLIGGIDLSTTPPRKLVEHVALLDSMDLTDIDTVARRGNNEQAARFERDARAVTENLGLSDVRVINDFPVALTALGYTRITRDPQKSVFNPFPTGEDGKIPLFVIPTETEGLWFQLDPIKVNRWLVGNRIVGGQPPEEISHAWAWLYREVLRTGFGRAEEMSPAAAAVELLVHTMSHVLLHKIEWSGFASSSIGEYLMPETLSFVIYANRFAEAKIGGLTTLFEQRLPLWLLDSAQSGRECVYDPLCGEDGGSCAGCLHREHNCPFFNRQLSRAVLYGGVLPQDNQGRHTSIRRGYWHDYVNLVSRG
jgi:hypothetical protein